MANNKTMNSTEEHRRRSIRLAGYDYSQPGAYFVTIVCFRRFCLLGNMEEDQVRLLDAGRMVERTWLDLEKRFHLVRLDEYIVMPNHLHGILFLEEAQDPQSARVALGGVIGAFKSLTTNTYIQGVRENHWQPFEGKLWQRNYFERIIRDDRELDQIRLYILNNPRKWAEDEQNRDR